jgi:hypothetical protein
LRGPLRCQQKNGHASPAKLQKSDGHVAEIDRAEKIRILANEASQRLEADILFVNSGIGDGTDYRLIDLVCNRRRKPFVYLILVTEGGSADAGFRMARCLQSSYRRCIGVVPGWCKSAGTLICIWMHELQIGDLGQLGPLDVQLAKVDELALISSGLTIETSFRGLQSVAFQMFETFLLDLIGKSGGRITTKTAAGLAAELTTGLMAPIFGQVDPMKVGEDYRSTSVAEAYASRLDVHGRNLIIIDNDNAVETLVHGYPSHGFVIDREEARTLFRRVTPIAEPLLNLVRVLGPDATFPRSQTLSGVQYLSDEEETPHDRREDAETAPADDKSDGKKRRPKPATTPNGGKSEQSLSATPAEGDGKFPV